MFTKNANSTGESAQGVGEAVSSVLRDFPLLAASLAQLAPSVASSLAAPRRSQLDASTATALDKLYEYAKKQNIYVVKNKMSDHYERTIIPISGLNAVHETIHLSKPSVTTFAHELGHAAQNGKNFMQLSNKLRPFNFFSSMASPVAVALNKDEQQGAAIAALSTLPTLPTIINELDASAKGYRIARDVAKVSRLRALGTFRGIPSYLAASFAPASTWAIKKMTGAYDSDEQKAQQPPANAEALAARGIVDPNAPTVSDLLREKINSLPTGVKLGLLGVGTAGLAGVGYGLMQLLKKRDPHTEDEEQQRTNKYKMTVVYDSGY